MTIEITTPPGRIVWGSPTKSRGKTRKNPATGAQEPVIKDGVQAQQWAFGVAFDKNTFQQVIWPALAQEAATAYQGGQTPPKFAWKYVDGDGVDDQGKPFNQREGYAGCYVLAISTELMAPPIFKFVNGAYQQLPADAIKCGDWVSVGLNIKVNVPQDRSMTPGLYINPLAIEHVGYGTEIVSTGTADPNAIFKGAQHQLPAGASATPIGGGGQVGMPGMGGGQPMMQPGQPMGAPMQPGQPQMAPQPQYAPQQPAMQPMGQPGMAPPAMQPQPMAAPQYQQPGQPMMPAPAPDFVHNAGMPQQPMMQPGQPQMAPQPQYAPQQPMAAPQYQQPGQPMQQPGGMPGMMPGR